MEGIGYISERMSHVDKAMRMLMDDKYFESVDSSAPGHRFANLRLDMFNRYSERVCNISLISNIKIKIDML